MNNVTVKPQQNLFDILLQEYGTVDALFEFTDQNNISATHTAQANEVFTLNTESNIRQNSVLRHYTERNTIPATGNTPIDIVGELPQGIGYWSLEYEFIIS